MKKIISVFLSVLYIVSSLLVFPVTAQAKEKSITLDSTVTFTFDKKHKQYSFLFDVPEKARYTVYTENGLIDATDIFCPEAQYNGAEFDGYDKNMQYGWGIKYTTYIAETAYLFPGGKNKDKTEIIVRADVEAAGVERATITFGIKTHKCEMVPYKKHASFDYNGFNSEICKYCGYYYADYDDQIGPFPMGTIYKIDTIKLSKSTYVYNAKEQKPKVFVYTGEEDGYRAIKRENYTVVYPKECKNVGKYKIKIKFKNDYEGETEKFFTIIPKSTSISKLTAGKKKFTVKWKKQATQTSGYQIQYASNSKFTKDKKTVTVNKNKTTSKSISKLKANKKYYVRVRTYKTVNGKKIYSDWSKVKTVTTNK